MRGNTIDLSLPIYDGAPSFPGDPPCEIHPHNTIERDGYQVSRLSFSSHQGTHLDAPSHFFMQGLSVDQLPPALFSGEAFVVDLSDKAPGEAVTVDDFLPFEQRIIQGARVLCCTGWDKIYPQARYFTDHPALTRELMQWLVDREIALLGLDFPSPHPLEGLEMHRMLLRQGIVLVEGLAHLEKLPANQTFFFVAAPLRLIGRDGSPVRALGIVEQ